MTNQEKEQINRRFAELVGLCWHEYHHWEGRYEVCRCGEKRFYCDMPIDWANPDFITHPTLVLKEMMKREDFDKFGKACLTYIPIQFLSDFDMWNYHISLELILDTTEGKLALAAISWLEEEGK